MKTTKSLLESIVKECLKSDDFLQESLKKTDQVVICGGKMVPFGCEEHIKDLEKTLEGIELARDHYTKSSGNRYVFATACHRLKKLIQRLSPKAPPSQ